jgi:hypothetical protein
MVITSSACASHKKEILISGLVGAAAGAGIGYGVVHHGKNNQYEVQNTIITSSVIALLTMGAFSLHYYLMDDQKVQIMSNLTSEWIKNPENQNKVMQLGDPHLTTPTQAMVGGTSIKLDEDTRWAFPTFRRRDLQPELGADQITSARYTWEIVRPGFFVNRQTQPWYFDDSSTKAPAKKDEKP